MGIGCVYIWEFQVYNKSELFFFQQHFLFLVMNALIHISEDGSK